MGITQQILIANDWKLNDIVTDTGQTDFRVKVPVPVKGK